MTSSEREELDHLRGFVDLLGVSEMTDSEFDRYLELIRLEKQDGAP